MGAYERKPFPALGVDTQSENGKKMKEFLKKQDKEVKNDNMSTKKNWQYLGRYQIPWNIHF